MMDQAHPIATTATLPASDALSDGRDNFEERNSLLPGSESLKRKRSREPSPRVGHVKDYSSSWRPSGVVRSSSTDRTRPSPPPRLLAYIVKLPFRSLVELLGQGGLLSPRFASQAGLILLRTKTTPDRFVYIEMVAARREAFQTALDGIYSFVYREVWGRFNTFEKEHLEGARWLCWSEKWIHEEPFPGELSELLDEAMGAKSRGMKQRDESNHSKSPCPPTPPSPRSKYSYRIVFPLRKTGGVLHGRGGQTIERLRQACNLFDFSIHQNTARHAVGCLVGTVHTIRYALNLIERTVYLEAWHGFSPVERNMIALRDWVHYDERKLVAEQGVLGERFLDPPPTAVIDLPPFLLSNDPTSIFYADLDLPPPSFGSTQVDDQSRRRAQDRFAPPPPPPPRYYGPRFAPPPHSPQPPRTLSLTRRRTSWDSPAPRLSPPEDPPYSPLDLGMTAVSPESPVSAFQPPPFKAARPNKGTEVGGRHSEGSSMDLDLKEEEEEEGRRSEITPEENTSTGPVEVRVSIPAYAAIRFLAPSTAATFIRETTGCIVSLHASESETCVVVKGAEREAVETALRDVERTVGIVEKGWKLPVAREKVIVSEGEGSRRKAGARFKATQRTEMRSPVHNHDGPSSPTSCQGFRHSPSSTRFRRRSSTTSSSVAPSHSSLSERFPPTFRPSDGSFPTFDGRAHPPALVDGTSTVLSTQTRNALSDRGLSREAEEEEELRGKVKRSQEEKAVERERGKRRRVEEDYSTDVSKYSAASPLSRDQRGESRARSSSSEDAA